MSRAFGVGGGCWGGGSCGNILTCFVLSPRPSPPCPSLPTSHLAPLSSPLLIIGPKVPHVCLAPRAPLSSSRVPPSFLCFSLLPCSCPPHSRPYVQWAPPLNPLLEGAPDSQCSLSCYPPPSSPPHTSVCWGGGQPDAQIFKFKNL